MGKVGTKRSDRRWRAPNGTIWASEFEYRVYAGLFEALGKGCVSRCSAEEGHSFPYTTPVRQGACLECGAGNVVQQRIYTPDILVSSVPSARSTGDCYIETKGYFSAEKRNLLRNFIQTGPSISLCIILQRNSRPKGMKRTLGEYIDSYLKIPWFEWNPKKQVEVPVDILEYLK